MSPCVYSTAGATAIHFQKPALVDGTIDPAQPEVLLYEPMQNGQLRLAGVEFLIPSAVWDGANTSIPMLAGQPFMDRRSPPFGAPIPNYALYVWVWRDKPVLSPVGMLRTSQAIAAKYERSKVIAGDIVFAIRATIGKMRFVPVALDGANLTQGTARIAPSHRAIGRYLFWVLQSGPVVEAIEASCKGSTFREITLGRLRSLRIPLPPLPSRFGSLLISTA